jgi:hypothetical protein
LGVDPDFRKPLDPLRPAEEPLDVTIVLDRHDPVRMTQHERVVDDVGVVGRIRIPVPFEISKPPAVLAILSPIARSRRERLADVVRHDNDRAARTAVDRGGAQCGQDVRRGRRIHDGVVHEHDVELTIEPQRPHVPQDVLALRVHRPADGEHAGRAVGQRHAEVRLEVKRQAAAARPEF